MSGTDGLTIDIVIRYGEFQSSTSWPFDTALTAAEAPNAVLGSLVRKSLEMSAEFPSAPAELVAAAHPDREANRMLAGFGLPTMAELREALRAKRAAQRDAR